MLFQRAFAKINLGLRVLRRRPDGYHDIETIFFRVDVFDEVFVTKAKDLSLECDQPKLSSTGNLVYLAADLLQKALGVTEGARIVLRKKIPIGAGLGGGSADAAATLRLLSRLWGKTPSDDLLDEIALQLGSDVPYFLHPGSAHATSRGEQLSYFHLTLPNPILVLSPKLEISTREAYDAVIPNSREGSDDLRTLLMQHLGMPELLGNVLKNDFESPIFGRHPDLRNIKAELMESGAGFCALSGSGSSLFAIFPDEVTARDTVKRFSGRHTMFYTPPGFQPDLSIELRPVV